jgi:hypothetical protein
LDTEIENLFTYRQTLKSGRSSVLDQSISSNSNNQELNSSQTDNSGGVENYKPHNSITEMEDKTIDMVYKYKTMMGDLKEKVLLKKVYLYFLVPSLGIGLLGL